MFIAGILPISVIQFLVSVFSTAFELRGVDLHFFSCVEKIFLTKMPRELKKKICY
jgi:hypothetical protein